MLDQRGHGYSYKYNHTHNYTIKEFADDLNLVIQHFKIQKPIIIAHSFGCLVLFEYLIKYKPEFGKAVFLAANPAPRNQFVYYLTAGLIQIIKLLPFKNTRIRGRQIHYSDFPSNSDLDLLRTYADVKNTGLFTYLSCTLHASQHDFTSALDNIKIQTIFIHGKRDSIFNINSIQQHYHKIPNSKLISLPDANHLLIFSHINEICTEISEFINSDN